MGKRHHETSINPIALAVACVGALLHPGCKASQLTSHGTEVAVLASEPVGCERLGEVVGHGGGMGGGYTQKSVLSESAVNRARNEAAELGATHVVLQEPNFEHGTAKPATRDMQPALAHGDGSSTHASVEGVAYKCQPGTAPTVAASVLPAVDNPPASISLAPLGALDRVVVYRKTPATPGVPASDAEVLRLEDAAKVEEVSASLADLALDPIKYIPTHRIEFVGELGSQSLLYGFGYLQYAGNTYRLTTGTFERELQLVDPPAGSQDAASPASEPTEAVKTTPPEDSSGGEAP